MVNELLVADPVEATGDAAPSHVHLRALSPSDRDDVSRLYHQTYLGTPHEMTLTEAVDDIDRTWRGEYGPLIAAASIGAWLGGDLAGAVLTVSDPPWVDVPRGPFILDLFVDPSHRREGLGRALVQRVQMTVRSGIALRVDDSAPAARALYLTLGFKAQAPRGGP